MHTLGDREQPGQISRTVSERVVNCPNCQAPKTTKAAQNVRLKCGSCGAPFLAPPVPDGNEVTPTSQQSGPKTPAPRKGSGVKVVKASGVKVRSNAKTRKPKQQPDQEPAGGSGNTGDPNLSGDASRKPPAPPHQERSKIAGRRGGLAFYKNRVRSRKQRNAS